jgi:hypothetical protein
MLFSAIITNARPEQPSKLRHQQHKTQPKHPGNVVKTRIAMYGIIKSINYRWPRDIAYTQLARLIGTPNHVRHILLTLVRCQLPDHCLAAFPCAEYCVQACSALE